MKIKHYAGYGTVTASKVQELNPFCLHIHVEGNHERGVYISDNYDLFNWLVKRFDKTVSDYHTWRLSLASIHITPSERTCDDGSIVETCDYYFYRESRNMHEMRW